MSIDLEKVIAEVEQLRGTLGSSYPDYAIKKVLEILTRHTIAAESQWRPIETAPKDAELLLTNGHWVADGRWLGRLHGENGCWHRLNGVQEIYPTHWMPKLPLPAAPDKGGE